jgi:hypothetical protein
VPNQYTKAEEEGREKPEGQNAYTTGKRDRMDPAQKAKIRAAFAADKLEMYMKGEIDLTPAQVSAAKILMDKGMPSLQSVEQREVSEFEKMSEDEMRSMVQALITAHPWLIKEFTPGPQLANPSSDEQEQVENAA